MGEGEQNEQYSEEDEREKERKKVERVTHTHTALRTIGKQRTLWNQGVTALQMYV